MTEPTLRHPYTTESLGPDAPTFIRRTPGLREIARLFPEPASVGKGSLWVEGGVTIVGGPGMGKTSLLARVQHLLEAERQIPAALVPLAPPDRYPAEDGFYRYLGELVVRVGDALRRSPLLYTPKAAELRAVLAATWDGGAPTGVPAMTPRGLERWVHDLGAAAAPAGGICLLLDDVDHAARATWKSAFIAALRFTFQAAVGVTPIFGAWTLFIDESLPGSNYFRNVTRPVFLEPLSAFDSQTDPSERRALVDVALPELSDPVFALLSDLVGGHPQLAHRLLADLCESLGEGERPSALTPARVEALLEGRHGGPQRALASRVLAQSSDLAATLRAIAEARGARPYRSAKLSKLIIASGLVDTDDAGDAKIPRRVREIL